MKPLPAQNATGSRNTGDSMPSLPAGLATPPGSFSKSNRRASSNPVQRAYPWLLAASTAVAATFCLLYITKPVIVAPGSADSELTKAAAKPTDSPDAAPGKPASLLPDKNRLPGDGGTNNAIKPVPADPRKAILPPTYANQFEETNLRIQHILTAEAPGGHVDRIDLDVPVLYQSRSLRWTPDEVAEARTLLTRLMDYQEKSQALRGEGIQLLDAWNRLVGNSIPSHDLRADSPSLPSNQTDTSESPRLAGSLSNDSIQIQPSDQ